MKNKLTLFLIFIVLIITSCSKDNINQEFTKPPVNNVGTGVINENVYVFNEEQANSFIDSYSDNTIVLLSYPYFLEEGDIINSGISEKTPDGFLKKIKTVKKEGEKTIIEVENASLEEAVKEATLSISREATFNNLGDLYDDSGNLIDYEITEEIYNNARASVKLPRINIPINIPIGKNLLIQGNIGISAIIEANLKFKDGKIDELGYCVNEIVTPSLTMKGDINGIDFRQHIATIPIDKITAASGITMVFRPTISLYLVLESGQLSFVASIEKDFNTKLGFSYTSENGFQIINENNLLDFDVLDISNQYSFEASLYTGLSIVGAISVFDDKLFSLGIEGGLGITFKFDAEISPNDFLKFEQPKYGIYFTASIGPYINDAIEKSIPELRMLLKEYTLSHDFKLMEFDAFPIFEEKEVLKEDNNVSVAYTLERVPRFLFTKIGAIVVNELGDLIEKIEYDETVSIFTELGKEYNFEFSDLDKETTYHIYPYVSLFEKPYYMNHTVINGDDDDNDDDDDDNDDDDDDDDKPIEPLEPDLEYFVGTWEYTTSSSHAHSYMANVKGLITINRDKTYFFTLFGSQTFQWHGSWDYIEPNQFLKRLSFSLAKEYEGDLATPGTTVFLDKKEDNAFYANESVKDNVFKRVNTPHTFNDLGYCDPVYAGFQDGYDIYYYFCPLGDLWTTVRVHKPD